MPAGCCSLHAYLWPVAVGLPTGRNMCARSSTVVDGYTRGVCVHQAPGCHNAPAITILEHCALQPRHNLQVGGVCYRPGSRSCCASVDTTKSKQENRRVCSDSRILAVRASKQYETSISKYSVKCMTTVLSLAQVWCVQSGAAAAHGWAPVSAQTCKHAMPKAALRYINHTYTCQRSACAGGHRAARRKLT